VAAGLPLSEAVAKHPVSRLYVATLRAGERSGDLVSALERFLAYRKKVAEVRQQVVAASVYPIILAAVSLFTLAFLLFYVVPAFAGPFADAGAELPGLTRALLGFSEALRSRYSLFLLVLVGLSAGGFFLWRTEGGRRILDRWKLSVPVLGTLYFHYAAAILTRTLGTVLSGGTPLVESLRVAGGVLDNRHLNERLRAVGKAMEQGERFADSLRRTGALPGLAVRMIDAGEGAGAMGPVLEDVADYYDADVNARLRMLTAAVEPALMILMGGLIGLIVLAMYLPIFQLAGTIS
jgi:type IV pilus assembly protein PilC